MTASELYEWWAYYNHAATSGTKELRAGYADTAYHLSVLLVRELARRMAKAYPEPQAEVNWNGKRYVLYAWDGKTHKYRASETEIPLDASKCKPDFTLMVTTLMGMNPTMN